MANYADDFEATPENVGSSVERFSDSLFKWFSNNQMMAHAEKCHLLMNVNVTKLLLLNLSILTIILKRLLKKSSYEVHVLAEIVLIFLFKKETY